MAGTATRPPVRDERPRASLGRWVAAAAAWLVAAPAFVLTLMLEWAIAEEYGTENVGQYALALPALLLVSLAVGLTLRAAGLARWSTAAVGIASVLVVIVTAAVVLLAPG